MKKGLFKLILVILSITAFAILPLLGLFAYAKKLPDAYKDSYYAALPLKYDRLKSVEGEKVVVIGGSSVAFGIDSKIMEEELGKPCVNFGLYAALGLKVMMDLSVDQIGKGDVVVLAPEISSQMFSDYVGYEFLMEALESRSDMVLDLGTGYAKGLLASYTDYVDGVKKLQTSGGLNVSGVYAYSSFDSYGDIIYPRQENTMDGLYSEDNIPEINADIVSDSFAKMINEYVEKVERKGAKVYFTFCPINEKSVENISKEDAKAFADALRDKLDCQVIGSLSDHTMDARYFYDSNFHCNDAGVIYNTVLLVNDLKRVDHNMTLTSTKIPDPISGGDNEVISSGSDEFFTYDVTAAGVIITGLTDAGKKEAVLNLPNQEENYAVYKIGSKAFEDAEAEEITIPSSVTALGSSPFANAKKLTLVHLQSQKLPAIGSELLKDINDKLVIMVPENLYGNYATDYFWGEYASHIAAE